MKNYLVIDANRDCYAPDQIRETMTVAELILLLEGMDEDAPVILSHDNGYTYGGITWREIREEEFEDE